MKFSTVKIVRSALMALMVFCFSSDAFAGEKIHVVFKDPYYKKYAFEMVPQFGLQMTTKYTQTMAAGLSLAMIFNNLSAIELSGLYFFGSDTTSFYDYLGQGEQRFLPGGERGDTFSLTPADAEVALPEWAGTLALRLTPIYGKFTLMNAVLANIDVFFLCGAGIISTKIPENLGSAEVVEALKRDFTKLKMAGVFGGGMRFFLTSWLNIRAEFRDYIWTERGRSVEAIQNNREGNDAGKIDEKDFRKSSSVRSMFTAIFGIGFVLPP